MNYEQKYKDALDAAKHIYDDMKSGWNFSGMEDLEVIFPELAESEDERIRKEMIEAISEIEPGKTYIRLSQEEKEAWIDYLEKQKELFESGRGLYYYDDEKTTYCGYPATEENPYDFAMNQQEEQKEQKPTLVDKLRSVSTPAEENWFEIQKKWEKEDEQKPAEWSEEDEKMRKDILRSLECYQKMFTSERIIEDINDEIFWFKSLRPSWKPSEEQMGCLERLIYFKSPEPEDIKGCEELYEQLKKLM